MAEEEDVELATDKSGISIKTIVIIAVVVIVIMATSIGLTIFFLSGNSSSESASSKIDDTEVTETEESKTISKPAIYFLLKPDFIINFESEGKANFLSVQIEIMAREQTSLSLIENHMPLIRNNILLLLSSQKYEVVRTLEGKNKLRKDILKIMKKVTNDENKKLKKGNEEDYIDIAYIEAIFFTGFIMQ